MWIVRNAKGDCVGSYPAECDALLQQEVMTDIAGCLAPYSVEHETPDDLRWSVENWRVGSKFEPRKTV